MISNELPTYHPPTHIGTDVLAERTWRDERGVMPIGLMASLGKKAWFIAGGMAGIVAAVSFTSARTGLEASADLDKAQTTAKFEMWKFDETTELQVAEGHFRVVVDAEGIESTFTLKNPIHDISYTTDGNRQLTSDDGVIEFQLPVTALNPVYDTATGTTDITVDMDESKVTVFFAANAMPVVKAYTINSGGKKKNFDDPAGFRKQILEYFAGYGSLFNMNTLKNTINDLDTEIDRQIAEKALQELAETCPPKLKTQLEQTVRDAIDKTFGAINPHAKLGKVTLSASSSAWKIDLPEAAKYKAGTTGLIAEEPRIRDWRIDEATCSIPSTGGSHG